MAYSDEEIEKNRRDLLAKLEEIKGKTAKDIDSTKWMAKHPRSLKGSLGEVVQIYLGKKPDSDPDKDFPEADVELKATGLEELKSKKSNSFSAKERLVLTMINYKTDYGVSFSDSHVVSKCHSILLTCYNFQRDSDGKPGDYRDFPFIDSFIFDLKDKDRQIIEDDYDTILKKVNEGKAETISQSDTKYLEACPKGRNSNDKEDQFGSSVRAMKRAFALKPSFLNCIIRQHISNEKYESAMDLFNQNGLLSNRFEDSLKGRLLPYFGEKAANLFIQFGINPKSKGAYANLISKILGKKDLAKTEEFIKANIHIKTVRVEKNGHIKEQMSFPTFKFKELAYTPWEESDWQAYFNGAEFMIPVFRDKGDGYVFDDVIFYRLSDLVTEGFIRYTYEKTQKTLLAGNVVSHLFMNKNGKQSHKTNFVGMKENPICHIRPHGINFAKSQIPLPVKDLVTGSDTYASQCLWFGSKYIAAIVQGNGPEFEAIALDRMKKNGCSLGYDL